MKYYFTLNTVAEMICLLVAAFCLAKDKTPIWRYFIVYLLLTCATELTGVYIREMTSLSNAPFYNVYLLIECGFISCFFYQLYLQYTNKRSLLIIWLCIFLVMYVLEGLKFHFAKFVNLTASTESVVFVLASLYFYYLILRDDKYIVLNTYAPFWWVNGTLIFYFGSTATNIFNDYLVHEIKSITMSIRYVTYSILNVLLYACWSYAFICRFLQRKYYSSSASQL
ncbi:hypothetical protein [Chitinophaga sancti]|uniref:YhhN-like protein n=1 Tax=Chitinophaga sancti TaxID=1004 RepID=A0A1K1SXS6_9BACT|nr:hypothetical protein [Chitinophaga sancti]WQD63117.1 hypothetical protein U0033_01825 [Chitinophaga sancti]WQG91258.1 hypothetical protein SR876_07090 [Chitinophaga sancti]SFW88661.1 hypothetical protein SAMN05661012_06290 [Chitinophaga sancti]